MKFIHLSDLHLGKRFSGFSLLEDQRHILSEIERICGNEKPDAVLIAGDVYDKSMPSAEAVELFDSFLTALAGLCPHVFVISGNHDSAERLAFGGRLMDKSGVHMAPVYSGRVEPVELCDEFGTVAVWMLPFIKPAAVRGFFPDEETDDYTKALSLAISAMEVDQSKRNVLIAHQFVTGAERCESEEVSVGGLDNVDASVFGAFDYVALGHIHGPQNIGSGRIRYCGTPLKYSFSEIDHEKSVTLASLENKGVLKLRTLPLKPLRDMAALRGSYGELSSLSFYRDKPFKDAFLKITLTDEDDIPDAAARLRMIYPYLASLDYDNARTRAGLETESLEGAEAKPPLQVFSEFFRRQNGMEMSEEQETLVKKLIETVWEERGE